MGLTTSAVEAAEHYLLTAPLAPAASLAVTLVSVAAYPQPRGLHTPSRAETALHTAACWGVHAGSWAAWHAGILSDSAPAPTPSLQMGVAQTVGSCG